MAVFHTLHAIFPTHSERQIHQNQAYKKFIPYHNIDNLSHQITSDIEMVVIKVNTFVLLLYFGPLALPF